MRIFYLLLAAVIIAGCGPLADDLPPARETEIARHTAEARNLPPPTARPQPTATPEASSGYQVVYRVTTSRSAGSISLTYNNATGNTEQVETRTNNYVWEQAYTMPPGEFLYVSAQSGETSGSVECEILVDGQVVEQAASNGAYVIASCSGSLPR